MLLALLQVHNQLVEQLRDAVQPRDVSLGIFLVIDLVDVDQERRDLGVGAAHLVYRIIVQPELEALRVPLDLELVDVATELRLLIELLFWELAL